MADKREQCKSCKMGCPENIFQIKLNTARIPFDKCLDFTPKQTNADRIRAMSDEELAEYLPIVFDMMCNPTDKCREITCNHGECTRTMECALKWLQSEAE